MDIIPISKEHIPITEGIVLPENDAEIGLQLGSNASNVYSPIEIVAGPSENPLVTITHIGLIAWNVIRSGMVLAVVWAINT